MRMWYARGLIIKNPDIRLVQVSQLCGYKDYSGFLKHIKVILVYLLKMIAKNTESQENSIQKNFKKISITY